MSDTPTILPMPPSAEPHYLLKAEAERVWKSKTRGCMEYDHYDINPEVSFFRDGKPLCFVVASKLDRDYGLAIADTGTPLMNADLVMINMDAHMTTAMENPATGKPWESGEMQGMCDNEGACATGLLSDAILTMAVFSDGHMEQATRRYHGHEKAGKLHWGEPGTYMVEDGNFQGEGRVPDALRAAMKARGAMQENLLPLDIDTGIAGVSNDIAMRVTAVQMMTVTGLTDAAIIMPETQVEKDFCEKMLSPEAITERAEGALGIAALFIAKKWGIV